MYRLIVDCSQLTKIMGIGMRPHMDTFVFRLSFVHNRSFGSSQSSVRTRRRSCCVRLLVNCRPPVGKSAMANLVAGGLKSLGQHLGVGGADNKVIISEYARTENLRLITRPKDPVILSDEISQTAEINDAPLVPEAHNNKKKVRHLLDIVSN